VGSPTKQRGMIRAEVKVAQIPSVGRSVRVAADEFARNHFEVPRKINWTDKPNEFTLDQGMGYHYVVGLVPPTPVSEGYYEILRIEYVLNPQRPHKQTKREMLKALTEGGKHA